MLDVNTAAVVSDFYSELCLVNIRIKTYKLKEELERTKVMVKANFTLEQATKAKVGVDV